METRPIQEGPTEGEMEDEVIFNVFFSGTSSTIMDHSTQISLFESFTEAFDITNPNVLLPTNTKYLKMSFDGCGVTNGMMGTLFAYGLDQQCSQVVHRVNSLVQNGKYVCLNCLGLSRGAIACIMLLKKLYKYEKDQVKVNMLLFDPVPGNSITSAKLDFFGQTIANQCMDISDSKCLERVLAIYPNIPLPDIAFHAPILPKYPIQCQVEEDVTLGCHQAAIYYPHNLSCSLTFLRIKTFLSECGTKFSSSIEFVGVNKEKCLEEMFMALTVCEPTVRYAHSYRNVQIVRKRTGKFLNRHHQQLAAEFGVEGMTHVEEMYMLGFEESQIDSLMSGSMSTVSSISSISSSLWF